MGVSTVRFLRALAVASVVGAWAVIVIGGYVTQSGSGRGCIDLVLCTQVRDPTQAAIESSHRVAAWVEGFLVLGMLVLVLRRYREWVPVRNVTAIAFLLIVAQASLGILAVATDLDPAVVIAHLGVSTAFLAVTVLNATIVLWGKPPVSVPRASAKSG